MCFVDISSTWCSQTLLSGLVSHFSSHEDAAQGLLLSSYHPEVASTQQRGAQNIDYQMQGDSYTVRLGRVSFEQRGVKILPILTVCEAEKQKSHIEKQDSHTCNDCQEKGEFPAMKPVVFVVVFVCFCRSVPFLRKGVFGRIVYSDVPRGRPQIADSMHWKVCQSTEARYPLAEWKGFAAVCGAFSSA